MDFLSDNNKIEMQVYNELKTVIDPELNINIVDLGLIYNIHYCHEKGIEIEMTLSSKGCPMGDAIIQDMEGTLNKIFPEIKQAIKLVWEPKWSSDYITAEGRKALGISY